MKTKILLFRLMIVSSMAFSQGGGFGILPEGGISWPVGFCTNKLLDTLSKYTLVNLERI